MCATADSMEASLSRPQSTIESLESRRLLAGDGFADVVLAYKNSGVGPIGGPYGGNSADQGAAPVGLGVVLGGDVSKTDYLSLPTGSFVTVGFNAVTAVDGTGDDLSITELVDT